MQQKKLHNTHMPYPFEIESPMFIGTSRVGFKVKG